MNTLPQNWLIEVTKENQEELDRWRQQVATENLSNTLFVGYTLLSSHRRDGSHYYCGNARKVKGLDYYADYQEITLEQFRQITNPTSALPTKWYIEATRDNCKELERWRKQVATSHLSRGLQVGHILLSKHHIDNSYFFADDLETFKSRDQYKDYQEITLEQFRQITNSNPTPNPMKKSIQITHSLLIEYYKAATTHQKEYLNIHFKLDGTTTDEAIRGLYDLACWDWKPRIKKNHPDCFPEDSKYFDFSNRVDDKGVKGIISNEVADSLGMKHDFIQIRSNDDNQETHYCSFYLTTDYDWKLVQDGGAMALIPTKKQS